MDHHADIHLGFGLVDKGPRAHAQVKAVSNPYIITSLEPNLRKRGMSVS